jgi:hypothetical protein
MSEKPRTFLPKCVPANLGQTGAEAPPQLFWIRVVFVKYNNLSVSDFDVTFFVCAGTSLWVF